MDGYNSAFPSQHVRLYDRPSPPKKNSDWIDMNGLLDWMDGWIACLPPPKPIVFPSLPSSFKQTAEQLAEALVEEARPAVRTVASAAELEDEVRLAVCVGMWVCGCVLRGVSA